MIDNEKIDYTLTKIKELWIKCPSFRLGQLLNNLSVENGYVYGDMYIEDEVLIKKIENKLKELENDEIATLTKMKDKYI